MIDLQRRLRLDPPEPIPGLRVRSVAEEGAASRERPAIVRVPGSERAQESLASRTPAAARFVVLERAARRVD